MTEKTCSPDTKQYYLDSCLQSAEVTRLDVQHQMWLYLLNGSLITAPHPDITHHLDIGCGSGVWTTAFAKSSPCTTVHAIDLTPPNPSSPPSNLTFLPANAEHPWTFTLKNTYDLITARVLVSSIRDWPRLFRRSYTHLRSGGWLEVADVTIGTFSDCFDWRDETSPLMRWYQAYRRVAGAQGVDGFANHRHGLRMRKAGFVGVTETWFRCYLDEGAEGVQSARDREVAKLTGRNALGLLEAVTKVMVQRGQWDILGMDERELMDLMVLAKEDIVTNAKSRGYYWTYSVHIGQKSSRLHVLRSARNVFRSSLSCW